MHNVCLKCIISETGQMTPPSTSTTHAVKTEVKTEPCVLHTPDASWLSVKSGQ